MEKNQLLLIVRMEWMKTCCRMNLFFSIAMFMLLVLQVGVLVRVELSGEGDEMMVMAEPEIIFQYAGRYISNLAFTFMPLMLLINIGREFDFAVVQRSLVSGINRKEFFAGKTFQLAIFSMAVVVFAIVFRLLAAAMYSVPVIWDLKELVMYGLVAFCLGSLALMVVFMVKKRFYALAVFMGYALLENTFSAIMSGRMMYLPFQTCIGMLRRGNESLPDFVALGVYTAVFNIVAWKVFRRSDLR
jgi:hypothetical protein